MINRTSDEHDAARFSKAAQQLLASGSAGDELLHRSATVLPALPVHAPSGTLHSWFVPVTVGDRLAALFQFLQDGTLMRFSSFQRRAGDFTTCPAAADWLDTKRIQMRAEGHRLPNEVAQDPFLSFDRSPDRLVWAVPFANKRGEIRLVYVSGETVYLPPPEGTLGAARGRRQTRRRTSSG